MYYGDEPRLAKYGYSRDHQPGERQLTLGIARLAQPYNIPIGMTIEAGWTNLYIAGCVAPEIGPVDPMTFS